MNAVDKAVAHYLPMAAAAARMPAFDKFQALCARLQTTLVQIGQASMLQVCYSDDREDGVTVVGVRFDAHWEPVDEVFSPVVIRAMESEITAALGEF